MAMELTDPRTRRAVLVGSLGGMIALVAQAVGRPLGARAADGDAVHVGDDLTGTRVTSITTTSGDALHGVTTSETGCGVVGIAAADSGQTSGVLGQNEGTEGAGVHGRASAVSGVTAGVVGECASPEGVGVSGRASADIGGIGVLGRAAGNHGFGMLGEATASEGSTTGVFGRSLADQGHGVVGIAAGGTGVYGYSGFEPQGTALPATGVHGVALEDGGRGAVLEGRVAQLRLMPSVDGHPASGETGDLFVDPSGGLWYCRGGGDWKQLA